MSNSPRSAAPRSVNQRLFDSLHEELLKYRDNFLHESLQKPFIHDLVHLFDDLTSLSSQLQAAAEKRANAATSRNGAIIWRTPSIRLSRSCIGFEVKEIEPSGTGRSLSSSSVISFEPADFAEEDGCIVMRVKRGFFWRGKLIRPEEVIAKRYG